MTDPEYSLNIYDEWGTEPHLYHKGEESYLLAKVNWHTYSIIERAIFTGEEEKKEELLGKLLLAFPQAYGPNQTAKELLDPDFYEGYSRGEGFLEGLFSSYMLCQIVEDMANWAVHTLLQPLLYNNDHDRDAAHRILMALDMELEGVG